MKLQRIFYVLSCMMLFLMVSCVDNNNKDNNDRNEHDSDYETQAPTYNKTRDEMNADSTSASETRVPKDSVEIITKGNGASK